MAEKSKPASKIGGALYQATVEGFKSFLQEANRLDGQGYDLIVLTRLDTQIAAVYRRRGAQVGEAEQFGSFFE
jgi:hypothetical protein